MWTVDTIWGGKKRTSPKALEVSALSIHGSTSVQRLWSAGVLELNCILYLEPELQFPICFAPGRNLHGAVKISPKSPSNIWTKTVSRDAQTYSVRCYKFDFNANLQLENWSMLIWGCLHTCRIQSEYNKDSTMFWNCGFAYLNSFLYLPLVSVHVAVVWKLGNASRWTPCLLSLMSEFHYHWVVMQLYCKCCIISIII